MCMYNVDQKIDLIEQYQIDRKTSVYSFEVVSSHTFCGTIKIFVIGFHFENDIRLHSADTFAMKYTLVGLNSVDWNKVSKMNLSSQWFYVKVHF